MNNAKLLKIAIIKIETLEDNKKKFIEDFAENPSYALSWSLDIYDNMAELKVWKEVERVLITKDTKVTIESLKQSYLRFVLNGTKYPSRSTSPTSNLMAECLLSAQATLLEDYLSEEGLKY